MEIHEKDLVYKIQGAVFEVYRELGAGFLESVYQNALLLELQNQGLRAEKEKALNVKYKNNVVGEFRTDIIVENRVLLELKAQKELPLTAEAQVINYLKVTGIKVGLLINFTFPKATIKRIIF
ncbi:MAG: GxxExxY protein [Trichlorobacter sp.]|jgi:GxxExxY protein|nr:GxxExxY protein [Trichlorobacter sp.]